MQLIKEIFLALKSLVVYLAKKILSLSFYILLTVAVFILGLIGAVSSNFKCLACKNEFYKLSGAFSTIEAKVIKHMVTILSNLKDIKSQVNYCYCNRMDYYLAESVKEFGKPFICHYDQKKGD